MYTPFIIGLYYLEEEYNVSEYVGKVFRECAEDSYLSVLASLAMLDKYNYKNVPTSFVKSILGLKAQEKLTKIVPSIGSLITLDNDGLVPTYRFKHSLLCQNYLKEYCRRKHDGSLPDMIFALTEKVIKGVAKMYVQNKLTETHLNMLISVIIQNKDEYDLDELNLSMLLNDVMRPEKQREVLELLFSQFVGIADSISEEGDAADYSNINTLIRRLVSHACAHLGHVYSRGEQNYKLAREWIEKSLEYIPNEDPVIFHMAGTVILDELRSDWRRDRDMLAVGTIDRQSLTEKLPAYESAISRAESLFEKVCDNGSPDYGYPSMLALYYQYLDYVYELREVRNERDIDVKLSSSQRNMIVKFLGILDLVKTYEDLDEKALSKMASYEGAFLSKIMLENRGHEIEYYQNRYDNCDKDKSILEWRVALRGLVQARLHKATEPKNGRIDYRNINDPKGLIVLISQLLRFPLEEGYSYFDYLQKCRLYHHWLQLAKLTEEPLQDVQSRLNDWIELEERKKKDYNPEPYYYLRAVSYLMALEGFTKEVQNARYYDRKIQDYDRYNLFDPKLANRYVLRDIITEGRGMGMLVDVTHLSNQEIISLLVKMNKRPLRIQGHIRNALNASVLLADVYDPIEWSSNIDFYIAIGKGSSNNLTTDQINDDIQYFGGFSINHPLAFSDYVMDTTAGTALDWGEISFSVVGEVALQTRKTNKTISAPKRANNSPFNRNRAPKDSTPLKRAVDKNNDKIQHDAPPSLKKTEQLITLTSINGKKIEGYIVYEGKQYNVRIVRYTGKDAEKKMITAKNTGRSLRVVITSDVQSNGFYDGILSL